MREGGVPTWARPPATDLVLGLGLTAIGLADALTQQEYAGGRARLVVAVVLQTLPLVWRRTNTLLAVSLSLLGVLVEVAGLEPYGGLYGLVGFLVLVHATSRWTAGTTQRYAVGALVAGLAAHTLSEPADGPLGTAGRTLAPLALGLVAWALGRRGAAAERRERALATAAAEREEEWHRRQLAVVEEERARISRELHDVVGHALAGISLTAGAAEGHPGHDAETRTALALIRTLSRDAASDVRRLVGLLREPGDELTPQPTLADLAALVARAREAGLDVHLAESGTAAPAPGGLHLAAYRLVQEGLTNAAKHAPGARVDVAVDWRPGRLDVSVRNDPPVEAVADAAPGHGLAGLHERCVLYDARLVAEPRPDGGFLLTAGFTLA